ncbi:hypothetical protein F2Q69_00059652 [Brassica cretica]|uniref:Uncharacterized protein n=1 Tax=Brassica cretica TaxID=69181 RepID=A0A8S9RLY1_BRACR|nr:hypothetical protein F2Q69_00059652 [Brassica cretica]
MEGSPYRKFSIFWKGARFQGPNSGFLLAGTWIVPLSGTRGSGSFLEAGGNDTGVFFPNTSHRLCGLLFVSLVPHDSLVLFLCSYYPDSRYQCMLLNSVVVVVRKLPSTLCLPFLSALFLKFDSSLFAYH